MLASTLDSHCFLFCLQIPRSPQDRWDYLGTSGLQPDAPVYRLAIFLTLVYFCFSTFTLLTGSLAELQASKVLVLGQGDGSRVKPCSQRTAICTRSCSPVTWVSASQCLWERRRINYAGPVCWKTAPHHDVPSSKRHCWLTQFGVMCSPMCPLPDFSPSSASFSNLVVQKSSWNQCRQYGLHQWDEKEWADRAWLLRTEGDHMLYLQHCWLPRPHHLKALQEECQRSMGYFHPLWLTVDLCLSLPWSHTLLSQ